jgi:hypothetical protein
MQIDLKRYQDFVEAVTSAESNSVNAYENRLLD